MKKKKNSVVELKKKYKKISNITYGCEYGSIILPFAIINIVNADKYFVQQNGVKIGLAVFLGLILMALAIWLTAKKKLNGSYLVLVLGWATTTLIFFLLGAIITDLATIMLFGLFGLIGAYVLDEVSKNYEKKSSEIEDAIKTAKKEELVSQFKKEDTNDGDCLG